MLHHQRPNAGVVCQLSHCGDGSVGVCWEAEQVGVVGNVVEVEETESLTQLLDESVVMLDQLNDDESSVVHVKGIPERFGRQRGLLAGRVEGTHDSVNLTISAANRDFAAT